MSFNPIRKLPSPDEVKLQTPLSPDLIKIKEKRDLEIRNVFEKKDNRLIIVIGPCSAHDEAAVCDYVSRLSKLQDEVKERLLLIPRIYTNKPRTTGEGYKGMAHQPDPLKSPNIAKGIFAIRKMHIKSLSESGLTAADEMLYPDNTPYLDDLLSYVAIGARSVENQQHRLTASGMEIPVGMKNPTSGDLKVMLNSIYAAQIPHVFAYNGYECMTSGNAYAHCILRGAVDHYGRVVPNYHYEDLIELSESYTSRNLLNPSIFIDVNHDNSGKQFKEQSRISMEVLRSRNYSPVLSKMIQGLMIESFIEESNQKTDGTVYGKSITDPCIGWNDTVYLLKEIAEHC
ncbi:MAG: 3-deoxy-7-phosphoheptulonate synthase [Chitinispirillaceae bacterium]|nr:3-deoxy-7-phosphoheptulonate synthase [Chitinispirillaceae bacterium]